MVMMEGVEGVQVLAVVEEAVVEYALMAYYMLLTWHL